MKNLTVRKESQRSRKHINKVKTAIPISQNVFFLASADRSIALEKPPFKYDYTYEEVLPRAIAELSFAMQNMDAKKLS
jgi:hypothetical protein